MEIVIIFLASRLPSLIVGGVLLSTFFISDKRRTEFILLLLLVSVGSLLLGGIAGLLIENPRPFVTEQIIPLIPHDPTNGFPSTHTLVTVSLALVVFVYEKRIGAVLFLLAILVGVGRVLAHVHSVVDVLGGITISIVATLGSIFLMRSRFGKDMLIRVRGWLAQYTP